MRGTVRRRGASWQAIVNVTDPATGRRRQLTGTRRTKAEAEQLVVQLLARAGRSHAAASTATLTELLEAWQEANAAGWSPGTVRNTRQFVDAYLAGRTDRVVRKLHARHLEQLYRDLLEHGARDGGPLAAGTVRRVHTIVRSALEQAVRWDWIAENPARKVDTRRVLAGEARPVTSPPPSAVLALLEHAQAHDPDFGAWLQVAADTGARRGEVCALRWSDIDLDAGTVRIERSIAEGPDGPVEKGTKTGNRRKVTLAPDTVARLRAHRRRCAERVLACGAQLPADAFAWSPDIAGARPWSPGAVTRRFAHLRAELGLDDIRLHDLRHFVASTLIGGGVDLATVAGRLGHAGGGRTTLAVYAHMLEHADQHAADLIARTLRPKGG